MQFRILNSKEQKEVWALVEAQWGIKRKPDGVLLKNNKNKIFLINRDIEKVFDEGLRIDSAGLYILEQPNPNEVRLSVEGTQLFGPHVTKNIVDLGDGEVREWLKGRHVETKITTKDFQIVRHRRGTMDDYMGCGKLNGKELRNYMPKTRRILAD